MVVIVCRVLSYTVLHEGLVSYRIIQSFLYHTYFRGAFSRILISRCSCNLELILSYLQSRWSWRANPHLKFRIPIQIFSKVPFSLRAWLRLNLCQGRTNEDVSFCHLGAKEEEKEVFSPPSLFLFLFLLFFCLKGRLVAITFRREGKKRRKSHCHSTTFTEPASKLKWRAEEEQEDILYNKKSAREERGGEGKMT